MGAIDLSKKYQDKLKEKEVRAVPALLALENCPSPSFPESGTLAAKNQEYAQENSGSEKEYDLDQFVALFGSTDNFSCPSLESRSSTSSSDELKDLKMKSVSEKGGEQQVKGGFSKMKKCFTQLFNMTTPTKSQVTLTEEMVPSKPRRGSPHQLEKSTSPIEHDSEPEAKASPPDNQHFRPHKLKPKRRVPQVSYQGPGFVSSIQFTRNEPPPLIPVHEIQIQPQWQSSMVTKIVHPQDVMAHCCINCHLLEAEFDIPKSKITAPGHWAKAYARSSKTVARSHDHGMKRAISTSPVGSVVNSEKRDLDLPYSQMLKEAAKLANSAIPFGPVESFDDHKNPKSTVSRRMKKIRMYDDPKQCSEYVGIKGSKNYHALKERIETFLKTHDTQNVHDVKIFTGTLPPIIKQLSDEEWTEIVYRFNPFLGIDNMNDLDAKRTLMLELGRKATNRTRASKSTLSSQIQDDFSEEVYEEAVIYNRTPSPVVSD